VTLFTAGPAFLRVYMTKTFTLFYISGQEWRNHRKLVSPAFSSGTLDVYFDVFKNNADVLIQIFMTKVGAGEFDVSPYLNLYALDSITGECIKMSLEKLTRSSIVFLPCKSLDVHKFCGK